MNANGLVGGENVGGLLYAKSIAIYVFSFSQRIPRILIKPATCSSPTRHWLSIDV